MLPSSHFRLFHQTLRESNYVLLYEAMLTLVLLLCPSLHRPSPRSPAGSHPLLDCIHQQVHLAPDVVQKLFKVCTETQVLILLTFYCFSKTIL